MNVEDEDGPVDSTGWEGCEWARREDDCGEEDKGTEGREERD